MTRNIKHYNSNKTNGRSVSNKPHTDASVKYMSVRNDLVSRIKDNSRERSAMSREHLGKYKDIDLVETDDKTLEKIIDFTID